VFSNFSDLTACLAQAVFLAVTVVDNENKPSAFTFSDKHLTEWIEALYSE